LKLEAPEGVLVTGYPWYGIALPAHKAFVDKFTSRTGRHPVAGALVGYVTFQSIFAAIRKAQTTDTESLVAALEALTVETPSVPSPSGLSIISPPWVRGSARPSGTRRAASRS